MGPLPTLEVVNLHKSFDGTPILQGVNLRLDGGEAVAVLGRSGSGKTTLLRLLSGLEVPDQGVIRLGDAELSGPNNLVPPHLRHTGYVFQSPALWPHLTVGQNVLFGVRERDKAARNARLAEMLGRFEIADLEKRYPSQISGGQARRVALARSLAPAPSLLLFDEAFTNVDWELRERLYHLYQEQVRGRATVVFVTHDPEEARRYADRQVLLRDGLIGPAEAAG